ncbi:MAG: hypothetical protein P4M11_08985 [Candidatus Pacebacteria bacterium]|nr:hypothetical protein [Candidatus Paceibacterota bacterium]
MGDAVGEVISHVVGRQRLELFVNRGAELRLNLFCLLVQILLADQRVLACRSLILVAHAHQQIVKHDDAKMEQVALLLLIHG